MKNLLFTFLTFFSVLWSPIAYGMEVSGDLEKYLRPHTILSSFKREDVKQSYDAHQRTLKDMYDKTLYGRSPAEQEKIKSLEDKNLEDIEFLTEKCLRTLLESIPFSDDTEFFEGQKSCNTPYCYLQYLGSDRIEFLKSVLPEEILTSEEWKKILRATKGIESFDQHDSSPHFDPLSQGGFYFTSDEFYESLTTACMRMKPLLQEHDTVIGIGNTPQFVMEALKVKNSKSLNYVKLACSGSPGVVKKYYADFIQGILTPQALENYTSYLERQLGDLQIHTRIFFVDIIGSGGGPAFINDVVHHIYKKKGLPIPEIHVIALNTLNEANPFKSPSLRVHSLKMTNFAKHLDKVSQDNIFLRVTPDFPARKWHTWQEPKASPGPGAERIIDNIRQKLQS